MHLFSNGFSAMQLNVTDNVFRRIIELARLDQINNPILRVSVDSGGCNGFQYNYEFTPKVADDDLVVEQDNIKIVVDPISAQFLDGCIVNFVEELGSNYFEIKNPNATGKCGCGNSFSM